MAKQWKYESCIVNLKPWTTTKISFKNQEFKTVKTLKTRDYLWGCATWLLSLYKVRQPLVIQKLTESVLPFGLLLLPFLKEKNELAFWSYLTITDTKQRQIGSESTIQTLYLRVLVHPPSIWLNKLCHSWEFLMVIPWKFLVQMLPKGTLNYILLPLWKWTDL